jgi:hypothetical protein
MKGAELGRCTQGMHTGRCPRRTTRALQHARDPCTAPWSRRAILRCCHCSHARRPVGL